MYEAAVFYVFGSVLVLSGLAVITARNPVHGVLFLVLAFFTASAIWLLLRAEFLAIVLVAIIAAIALTLRRRKDSRGQDPGAQAKVRRADRVRMVSMPAEKE